MADFKLYLQGVDALEAIISFGIPALAFLVFAVLGVMGGTELAARVRVIAKGVRKYVDEPTDQLILAVEGVGEFVLKKDLDPKVLSRILTAIADAMGEGVPLGDKLDAA